MGLADNWHPTKGCRFPKTVNDGAGDGRRATMSVSDVHGKSGPGHGAVFINCSTKADGKMPRSCPSLNDSCMP
jgi:hypothetical protein